jgi:hypothetical protein
MLDIDAVLLLPRDRPNLARGAGLEPSARSAGKFKVWTGPFLAAAAFSHYQNYLCYWYLTRCALSFPITLLL